MEIDGDIKDEDEDWKEDSKKVPFIKTAEINTGMTPCWWGGVVNAQCGMWFTVLGVVLVNQDLAIFVFVW